MSRVFSGRSWGYVFAFFGTVFFAMKAIFVKLFYQPHNGLAENSVDAITIMALRLGISAPIYIGIFLYLIKRIRQQGGAIPARRDLALSMLLGMLGYYICAWLDIQGLKYITAQLERLLLFTYPVFVFILGAAFFGKPMTRGGMGAIALAYAGIAIIFASGDITVGQNVWLGSIMVLSCAFLFALFQLFAKPMINRISSPIFTCMAMLGAGLATATHFIGYNLAGEGLVGAIDQPQRIWLLGLAVAFLSTLIPSFLVNIAIGRIGPQAVAALGMVSPIATIILAIVWLGEPFGVWDAIGTGLTIAGIGLYTFLDRRAGQMRAHSTRL